MSLKCVMLAESSRIILTRGIHSTASSNGVIRDALRKARELANASGDGKDEVGKAVSDAADHAKDSPSGTAKENAKATKKFLNDEQNEGEDEAFEQKKQKVDKVRADAEKRLENVQGLIGDLMQDASAALRHK